MSLYCILCEYIMGWMDMTEAFSAEQLALCGQSLPAAVLPGSTSTLHDMYSAVHLCTFAVLR